jgi:hypothetical protein
MARHDHPEACQHTVAYCAQCTVAYCTVCGTQWVPAPLPGVVAPATTAPGSPQEARMQEMLAAAPPGVLHGVGPYGHQEARSAAPGAEAVSEHAHAPEGRSGG